MLRSDRGPRRALWFIDDAGEFPAIEMGIRKKGKRIEPSVDVKIPRVPRPQD